MNDTVILVENLAKTYHIGLKEASYRTFRDVVSSAIVSPFRAIARWVNNSNGNSQSDEGIIHALKNISFEVKRGDVLGVIGKNGAGKSTLLKILSRITEPSSGYAEIRGRIGSLLEVGTGFHPELTGRENIYLNGAILGMKKAEIEQKFDEIVAFSELDKFLDTPVKHYSSGMYVRLAFAVAAHLEPEILLVDEVLAVGDVAFQKKCLGKIKRVSQEGRTVVFVSHNMAAVESLCNRGIVISSGEIALDGTQMEAISKYLSDAMPTEVSLIDRTDREGSGELRV
ncbi:MAG TPA: ABC transporter ATP-binding protein, partial [Acidobacteriota bacterium]|nr:ABC transporter ATP-binding protein [Acidobacteriota bacterium]